MVSLANTFHSPRGAWPALRAAFLVTLCLGLTVAFLASVWRGPAAQPGQAAPPAAAHAPAVGVDRS